MVDKQSDRHGTERGKDSVEGGNKPAGEYILKKLIREQNHAEILADNNAGMGEVRSRIAAHVVYLELWNSWTRDGRCTHARIRL